MGGCEERGRGRASSMKDTHEAYSDGDIIGVGGVPGRGGLRG